MDTFHGSPVERPRKRGRPLTYEEKWMVHHVFEAFEKEKQAGGMVRIEDPYKLTSQYTGVARSLVATIAKSVRQTGHVPVSTMPGNRHQPSAIALPMEGRIRDFVFESHRQGAICNAKHIHALLKDEFELEVHERTVQRHLKRLGFRWLRTKNRPRSLREKAEIRQQRHDYLYEIRKNRQLPPDQQYQLVYLDESFLHHHHGGQYSWFSENDFVERMSGKGRRWCFIHAMQATGLIEGTFLVFEAKKSKGDYHQQFDWDIFQHWFQDQLLPKVSPRSLIVLDRCSFHTVCRDGIVPSQMRKAELQQWLTDRDIKWEEQWLRARLMEEVDYHRDKKPMVERFAEEQGHKLLFLPVHHPELNPIELIWATVKNYCGSVFSNSTGFKDQRKNLEELFKRDITTEHCQNVYRHVQSIEEKYWQTDLMFDDDIEIGEDELSQL